MVLAVIALCEQTALNSISPYLPRMTGTFPDVDPRQVGTYVGTIASAFALAQFATNFLWGWLSDRVGRKPVILAGTFSTAACFFAFGFCRTLWQAILVQTLMGLLNGNQGVVSTCLGEITDRSNQSQAFAYLPVIYGLGGITGPLLGGLLAERGFQEYPFLAPNLLSACILVVDLVVIMIFMEETLEQARDLPPLGKRLRSIFAHVWQFTSAANPTYLRRGRSTKDRSHGENASLLTEDETSSVSASSSIEGLSNLLPDTSTDFTSKHVFNRNTLILLGTYLVFQLSNISYNSLYPIFAQAPAPTGRALSSEEIGLSLSFAGLVTIAFQIGIFGKLREKFGNKATYRFGLGGFVIAFILMPFVGYKNEKDAETDNGLVISTGKVALWVELGVVLLIKTVATVGGLTSALLLVRPPVHFCVLAKLYNLDHKLSTHTRNPRKIKWPRTDSFRGGSCSRSTSFWQFVFSSSRSKTKRRSHSFWNIWRHCLSGLPMQLWHHRK